MDMDVYKVKDIIGNSQKFISPFGEPCSYYICAGENENVSNISIQKYWEKLKFMSENIDRLIQQAFKPEFYDGYGVNKKLITSSEEMCRQLVVDSFVLYINDDTIGSYLSNSRFMFGHFIDCLCSDNWSLIDSYFC